MYYVVTWDKYCSVVPDLWVNFENQNFAYPSTGSNATNAIKKRIIPEDDWEKYIYRQLLGPYDNYKIARDAEKNCIDISSSDEIQLTALSKQSQQKLPSKRLQSRKHYYDDIDESEANDRTFFILLVQIKYSKKYNIKILTHKQKDFNINNYTILQLNMLHSCVHTIHIDSVRICTL